ncbi:MAG: hypothetical protein J7L92_02255 [Dehalococcoidia bacterium]|nr:hypothetical protein [Dehalococcoidia bacterium]
MASREERQDQEKQAVVAEQFSFRELPGSIWKHIHVSPVESAVVVYDGQPTKVVGPGKHGIYGGFLGRAKRHIRVARFYTRDFTIELCLPVESGDAVELEAVLSAIVRVDDVAAYYRGVLSSQANLTIRGVEDRLSSIQEIESVVASECSQYEVDLLIYDLQIARQIVTRLREPLSKILKQKGLRLIEIVHFALQRGKASDRIKRRLDEWEDIIKATESAEDVEDALRDIEKRGMLKDSDFEEFKKGVREAGESKEAARAHLRSLAELQRQYEKERLDVLLRGEVDYRQRIEDSLAAASRREQELADALQRARVSGVEEEIQRLQDEHELALSRKHKALELWELEEKSRIEMDKMEKELELELRRKREELRAEWSSPGQVPTWQQENRRKEMERSQEVTQYCAYCNRPIPQGQTYFYCRGCGKGPLCNNDYFGDKGCAFCSKRGK